MCGIAGYVHIGTSADSLYRSLLLMLKKIYHRGPDDEGSWVSETDGIAIGHQRLSIIDLSEAGHQPMTSPCGRFVIIFNGEIYNHLALRNLLKTLGQEPIGGWRGHSDTETMLVSFSAWGIERTLQAAVGMFALAIWDKESHSLTLARDRMGEKPLYYGWQGKAFLFASELKALKAHPTFIGQTNWQVASTFLRLNYIPAPFTIHEGVFKLLPGCFLTLNQHHIHSGILPDPVSYWSLADAAISGQANPFPGNFGDAVNTLEKLVREAVQLQSVADVPVGAFLSGGIDSSTVVAMMQSATSSKVTTFSIGMPDSTMDESKHALSVARHLETNHIEYTIQARDALEIIPGLSEIWDEPFADSSQIPTYLVSRLARQKVTVALTGDGGDEFFLGYPHYAFYQKLWRLHHLGKLPWQAIFNVMSPFLNTVIPQRTWGKVQSIVGAWCQKDTQMLGRYWFDRYRQGTVPLIEQQSVKMLNLPILKDTASTCALWDAGTYLPDDILTKVDRAAMNVGLETRAPLLDHRIIEFAYSLPLDYKLHRGIGKKVLREVLYRYVPISIVNRPKIGFSIPLSSWLRNELREWAYGLISQIPKDSEVFRRDQIIDIWNLHVSCKQDQTEKLWGILNLLSFNNS